MLITLWLYDFGILNWPTSGNPGTVTSFPTRCHAGGSTQSVKAVHTVPSVLLFLWDGVPVCDDPQRFLESWLAQVVPQLLPMNPSVSCFPMIVRQVDFARPEAPLKIAVCLLGDGVTPNGSYGGYIVCSRSPSRSERLNRRVCAARKRISDSS
jgi:hypothetical protein